jgi:hypothetical protein
MVEDIVAPLRSSCPEGLYEMSSSDSGRTTYQIVDGKQRLLAITDFLKDVFPTSAKFSDTEIAGLYFSDLPEWRRQDFFRYLLPVEILDSTDTSELIEAFDRLNRNTAKLNAQELRNARFSGEFISLMQTLADHPFWEQVGLATKARVRRMLDIEYVSEIFLLTMHGVQEGKKGLDEAYAEYDEEIPNVELHRRSYERCRSIIEELWPHLTTSRFQNVADFYSLWAACLRTIEDGASVDTKATASNLNQFAEMVRQEDADREVTRYLVAVTQGSDKEANRNLRAEILYKYFVTQAG